ncbi:unnamed protein product [Calicophoron daubneyi]|uniref:phenylalanine--tRNA ligase n=1 Tax=Calicophoron daubneyi TaxID=300641 RepID=A0AAV2T688_CALDB
MMNLYPKLLWTRSVFSYRTFSSGTCGKLNTVSSHQPSKAQSCPQWVKIADESYIRDSWFNITPRIIDSVGRNLHNQRHHPLCLVKQRIVDFMLKKHARRSPGGQACAPLFSVHDNLSPVVSTRQNFDSLLIPPNHPSRSPTDTYYVNQNTLLRCHTSAHDSDLISSGLDAFITVGDVYRRDDVDSLHYPVFHQLEGVRLYTAEELFRDAIDPSGCLQLLDDSPNFHSLHAESELPFHVYPSYMLPPDKQPRHTHETAKRLEFELKTALQSLAQALFGKATKMRWVDAYFPFTHPSWELEVKPQFGYTGDDSAKDNPEEWTELLGCGLLRQEILDRAGVSNKAGYAFGLGLERWAMQLYRIPDIRLFWSQDSGFLSQFETDNIHAPITYKPVSIFPQCTLDMSFWLAGNFKPTGTLAQNQTPKLPGETDADPHAAISKAVERDFYDLVRSVAGDLIEQVRLIDHFTDPKTGRHSHCYRLIYRDQQRTLTLEQVRPIHDKIAKMAVERFGVKIR